MNKVIQKSKKRINYLDIAKGISIILVVFGHIISVHSDPLQVWIYSFHIPVFFIISGMIYTRKPNINKLSIGQFIYKRASQLLYPYFIFGVVFLARFTTQVVLGSGNVQNLFTYIISLLTLVGVSVLWFLSTLFLSEIIFEIIIKQNTYIKIVSFVGLLTFTIAVSFIYGTTLDWNCEIISYDMYFILLCRTFSGVVFLMIGYYTIEFVERCNKSMDVLLVLVLLPASFLLSQLNGDVDLNKFFLGNPIIYYITAIVGSGAIIFISKLINNEGLLSFYGKNSLIIMITHSILGVYKISSLLISNIQFLFNNFYIEKLVVLVMTLIFETMIIFIVNKYCVFFIKKPSWLGGIRIAKNEG